MNRKQGREQTPEEAFRRNRFGDISPSAKTDSTEQCQQAATLLRLCLLLTLLLVSACVWAAPSLRSLPLIAVSLLVGGVIFRMARCLVHVEEARALAEIRKRRALHLLQNANDAPEQRSRTNVNHQLLTVQAELAALQAANDQLSARATTDGMTGLANHRAFQEELSRQIARMQRSNGPLSLLLLDVDYFKQYNDAFGHPAGDEVLKSVARILVKTVREGDFPARYGGEEFAVILPDTMADTAAQVAERVRLNIEAETFPNRQITLSIGVTQWVSPEAGAVTLQRVDVALYEAKTAGRNRVMTIKADMAVSAVNHEILPDLQSWTVEARGEGMNRGADASFSPSGHPAGEGRESDSFSPETEAGTPSSLYGGLEGLLQEPSAQILAELLAALEKRVAEPRGHSERVARYTLRLGMELAAWYEQERENRPLLPRLTESDLAHFAFGALLHDIGNVGLPDALLCKVGKLTEDEWRQVRRHPLAGAELIAEHPLLSRALPVVRYHHERWDGDGYPQGLAGEAIPLGARIFSVCDTLDILTTTRPYRAQMTYPAAREEIARGSGTQFDPDVVAAFLRIPEEEWLRLTTPHSSALSEPMLMPYSRAA